MIPEDDDIQEIMNWVDSPISPREPARFWNPYRVLLMGLCREHGLMPRTFLDCSTVEEAIKCCDEGGNSHNWERGWKQAYHWHVT